MTMIQFVENYEDLSTDLGFQFKFHCDKCHNGYMSRFQSSAMGLAGSALRAAGDLFGGFFGNAGNSAFEVQRAVGGKAHDEALMAAVQEGKQFFKQCTRCGKWVCPDVCWNVERGMCDNCAPKLVQEMTAAQAQAARDQVWEKAKQTDQTEGADLSRKARVGCPHCGAAFAGGKFCGECGKPYDVAKDQCGKCNAKMTPNAKFCPECGTPRA
jgi:hypothetical protein